MFVVRLTRTLSSCAISCLSSTSWTSFIAARNCLATSPGPEFCTQTTGGCALGPRAPILPGSDANWNLWMILSTLIAYHMLPGHSDLRQSVVSVEFPTQVSLPPKAGSEHARALTLDPLPQDVEHSDHWPHICHSLSIPWKQRMSILGLDVCLHASERQQICFQNYNPNDWAFKRKAMVKPFYIVLLPNPLRPLQEPPHYQISTVIFPLKFGFFI